MVQADVSTTVEQGQPNLPALGVKGELEKLAQVGLNPDDLRAVSSKTRQDGGQFYAVKGKEEATEIYEARKAETIIDQIPYLAEMERQAGRSFGMLVAITETDFQRPDGVASVRGYVQPEWLSGALKNVYEHCERNGLAPTIEYWDDIRYHWAGHVIVVHFPGDTQKASDDELAEAVIGQIPLRASFAAHSGRSWTEVMSLNVERDFNLAGRKVLEQPGFSEIVWKDPGRFLSGAAREVFDHCKDRGLMPDLQYWEGPEGKSGYSLLAHWEKIRPDKSAPGQLAA